MREILEAFAYGELRTENPFTEKNSAYGQAMDKMIANEEKLKAVLDENGIEALNKFSDANSDINNISCIERFIFGYRLGVLMTMEVFAGKNELFHPKNCSTEKENS